MNKELSKKVAKFKTDYHKLKVCQLTTFDDCMPVHGYTCEKCDFFVVEDDLIETAKEIIDEFVKGSVDVENL